MALPLSSSSTPSLSFTATPSKSLSCTLSPPNSTRFLTRRRFLSLKAMLTTVNSPSAADAGSGSPKVLLEVKNLRAVIAESRQEILRGVNLTINEDEVHAIMGKNGSGKSTFSKGLTKLLADNAPKAMKEQKFESYFGRKIVIDASMSIYQFLIVVGRIGTETLTNKDGGVTSHLQGAIASHGSIESSDCEGDGHEQKQQQQRRAQGDDHAAGMRLHSLADYLQEEPLEFQTKFHVQHWYSGLSHCGCAVCAKKIQMAK